MAPILQTIGFNYLLQGAFASIAIPLQTEKFYDFAGAVGFISSTLFAAYYPNLKLMWQYPPAKNVVQGGFIDGLVNAAKAKWSLAPSLQWSPLHMISGRQAIISAMILFWAGRLGSFLVQRIMQSGSDRRFDEIKKKPLAFAGAWFGQATWITLSGLPLWLLASVPAGKHLPIGKSWVDLAGLGIWTLGMTLEVVADRQKSAWRAAKDNKKHDEPFIKNGLWSWSRHPNYAGEIILWSGPSLLAFTTLASVAPVHGLARFVPYLCFVPSMFEYLLLTRVSGVPMLEEHGDKKFAKEAKQKAQWEEYKRKVPVLFALPGKHI